MGIGMPVVVSLTLPFPTLRSRVVTNEASAMIDWTHAEPYGQQPKAKNLIPHVVSTPRGPNWNSTLPKLREILP